MNQYVVGKKTENITSLLALVNKKVQQSIIIQKVVTCTQQVRLTSKMEKRSG